MPTGQISQAVQHLRRAVLWGDGAGLSDGQLLEHFIERRDEAAFETLVRRHGPMVLGVCRRLLRNYHDADDAFQATFLVLVRKAASVAPREMVGNWLYGVAYQTALKGRAVAAKRRARERQVTELPEPSFDPRGNGKQTALQDLQCVLDQELSRLPNKYRVPFVLCDLEGKSYKEAARQLGWPEGTLSVRLARARQMLAKGLTRHGISITAAALAAAVSKQAASACVPPSVISSIIKAAGSLAAGQVAAAVVSGEVAALTKGVLKAMLLTKVKTAMAVVVTMSVAGLGGGVLSYSLLADEAAAPMGQEKSSAGKQVGDGAKRKDEAETDQDKLQGVWKLVQVEMLGTVCHGAKFNDVGNLGIKGNQLFSPDREIPESTWYGTFKLDPRTNPKRITIERDDGQLKYNGIYSIDGDELRLCLGHGPDLPFPTEFKTKEGSPYELTIFQRGVIKKVEAVDDKKSAVDAQRKFESAVGKQVDAGEKKKNEAETDQDKLQGVWKLVRLEALGKVFGADKMMEIGDLAIDGDTLYSANPKAPKQCSLVANGANGSYGLVFRLWHGTFRLDTNTKPKRITIADEAPDGELKLNGIYSLEGDELRLCLNEQSSGTLIPSEFKTELRSPVVFFTFKREKRVNAAKKFERFYAGGFQSVRGFEFRGAGAVDEDQLLGEWVGKDPDGVSFTLIFGEKNYSQFDAEDGRHFRGTYSVDFKQTPHHLDFHWPTPGRFKTGEFGTIMELKDMSEIRIELTTENKPRPKEFTENSAVLKKIDYKWVTNQAPKTDKQKMQGDWQLIDGEIDGERIEVEGFGKIKIYADTMTLPVGEPSPLSFKLDTTKKPKQITMILKSLGTEAKLNGIYSLDGDDLKICFALKDGSAPKDFVTKKGSEHRLFILKRLKLSKIEKKQTKANPPIPDYSVPAASQPPVAVDYGFPVPAWDKKPAQKRIFEEVARRVGMDETQMFGFLEVWNGYCGKVGFDEVARRYGMKEKEIETLKEALLKATLEWVDP